jgi:hypothetical protein
LIGLFDHGDPAGLCGYYSVFEAFWLVSVTKGTEFALFAGSYNLHAALNYEHKSLRGSASQFPTGFEFSGVLRKSCTQGWTDMHDSDALSHAW